MNLELDLIKLTNPKKGKTMLIRCPVCGNESKSDEDFEPNTELTCPYCNREFIYKRTVKSVPAQSASRIELPTTQDNAQTRNGKSRKKGLGPLQFVKDSIQLFAIAPWTVRFIAASWLAFAGVSLVEDCAGIGLVCVGVAFASVWKWWCRLPCALGLVEISTFIVAIVQRDITLLFTVPVLGYWALGLAIIAMFKSSMKWNGSRKKIKERISLIGVLRSSYVTIISVLVLFAIVVVQRSLASNASAEKAGDGSTAMIENKNGSTDSSSNTIRRNWQKNLDHATKQYNELLNRLGMQEACFTQDEDMKFAFLQLISPYGGVEIQLRPSMNLNGEYEQRLYCNQNMPGDTARLLMLWRCMMDSMETRLRKDKAEN